LNKKEREKIYFFGELITNLNFNVDKLFHFLCVCYCGNATECYQVDFFHTAGVCATTDFHSQNFYCFVVASETLSEHSTFNNLFLQHACSSFISTLHSCFESTADKLIFLNPLSSHSGVLFFLVYISSIYVYLQRFIEIFKLEQFFSIQQSCKSESKKNQNLRRKNFLLKKRRKKYFPTIFF
jgi:hypothetical protein